MKVWISKKNYELLKRYQKEGRTQKAQISTFRLYEDEREFEVEIK